MQLTHSGRYSYRRPLLATHDPILDPLTVDKSRATARSTLRIRCSSDDDLKRIEDQYVAAARLAAKIGVDFVDLKQCHRYLLSELLAAKNRPGPYGGSLENRTRLVRNVDRPHPRRIPRPADRVRDSMRTTAFPYRAAGRRRHRAALRLISLPLETAFGTDRDDHLREDLREPIQLARWLRDWGVQLLQRHRGQPVRESARRPPGRLSRPSTATTRPEHPLVGVLRHFRLARAIQAAVPDVPVVGSGYSWLQEFALHAAAANVADGSVTLVGMGRGPLAQPDFAPPHSKTGRLDRTRICRTFSYCTNLMRSKDHPLGQYPTGCPPFDKEVYGPLWKEVESVPLRAPGQIYRPLTTINQSSPSGLGPAGRIRLVPKRALTLTSAAISSPRKLFSAWSARKIP